MKVLEPGGTGERPVNPGHRPGVSQLMICPIAARPRDLRSQMHTVDSRVGPARAAGGRGRRFAQYRVSAALLAGLLVIVGLATAWNLEGFPGRVDDDEGTYVSQAWAILDTHTLTHYSYWYAHPPLGWIQIAAFAWVTDGFNRVADAVYVGREFMWCLTLVGCVLVYVLGRRLGLRQATSAVAVLLFGLSPIAQYFHRMVSLDNIETVWVLAALVAATSAGAGWGPAVRTRVCTARGGRPGAPPCPPGSAPPARCCPRRPRSSSSRGSSGCSGSPWRCPPMLTAP